MMERSLYEVLEDVCADSLAGGNAPGELATLLDPWLTNPSQPTPVSDAAPLMLRMLADAPGWNRFAYSDPLMRQVSCAHYLLRAADNLNGLEDLEACLFLIGRGKEMLGAAYRQLQRD